MTNPRVSVVIPVHDGERFIKEAVECVLSQTYENIELIVVDDCSNDDTRGVIFRNWSREIGTRIRYVRNAENMERSFSRNKGFELCSGSYIFFLDHDDMWDNAYVEGVVNVFEEEDCDIVYSFPRTSIDADGNSRRTSSRTISRNAGDLIFSGSMGYPSASAFKRSSFMKYSESYTHREDWEIYLRSYLAGLRIRILDNDRVKMRAHEGRTSKSVKMWFYTRQIYNEYADRIPERYKGTFLLHVGDTCLRYGDLIAGWGLALRGISRVGEAAGKRRLLLNIIKRGLRIDRYFGLYHARKTLRNG